MFTECYGIIGQTVYQPQNWDAGTERLDLNPSSATASSKTLVKSLNFSESQFSHLLYVWIAISVGLGCVPPEADPNIRIGL